MYYLLRGTLIAADGRSAAVECGGVGYLCTVSAQTYSQLPEPGEEVLLYTHLSVREDAMELFGFCQKEERDMFKRLTSVSGIGPRSALGVLGSMPLADLRLAILTGDAAALSRAPGIGKKTAQRISLELKDKLAQDALSGAAGLDDAAFAIEPDAPAQDALGEALLALKSLGYTPQEAAAALKGVKGQAETPDELIKLALRHMAQNM